MNDDTPSGLATRDRALAFWTDPRNFSQQRTQRKPAKKVNAIRRYLMFVVWQNYINSL